MYKFFRLNARKKVQIWYSTLIFPVTDYQEARTRDVNILPYHSYYSPLCSIFLFAPTLQNGRCSIFVFISLGLLQTKSGFLTAALKIRFGLILCFSNPPLLRRYCLTPTSSIAGCKKILLLCRESLRRILSLSA